MARAHSFRKNGGFSVSFKSSARDQAGFVNLMNALTNQESAPTCGRCGGIVGEFQGPANAACKCTSGEVSSFMADVSAGKV